MTKILISPEYGGGWTSDHNGPETERRFMLTHAGLIEAVERQEAHDEADDEFAHDDHWVPNDWDKPMPLFLVETCLEVERVLREAEPELAEFYQADRFRRYPYEILKAIPGFVRDWKEKFSTKLPSVSGLEKLRIEEVANLDNVRIKNFDGAESLKYREGIWG